MRVVLKSLTTPAALLSIGILVLCIVLIACHNKISTSLWRGLCFVPLVLCIVHALCYPFGKQWLNQLIWFGPMYLLAVLLALWQFAEGKPILWRVAAVAVTVLAVVNFIYIPTSMPVKTHLHCYTRGSWADSFVKTLRTMQKEYPLSDWKGINYDALEAEFLPRVQAAERKNDEAELGVVLYDFTQQFHDGHIGLGVANNEIAAEVTKMLHGNDYGLSLITPDSGEVIAVNVEPGSEAEAAGIRTGTVITHWDGVPVQEAKQSFAMPFQPPVKENEEPARTMLLAGQGGERVSVTFLGEDAQPKTVQLSRIGNYQTRFDRTCNRFYHTGNDKNFSAKMVSDTCGYLLIHAEDLGALETAYAWITGKAPFISKRVDRILTELQAQGMESLIIDIRNNTGGHPQVSAAVAALFTGESRIYSRFSDGETAKEVSMAVTGNGKWKELPVVVLVNQNTVSAGDALALMLADCDNVTLMGMTHTNGSCQNTGGICVLAGGHYTIYYPAFLEVDATGDPFIDTDASRVSRIPLDVRIPLDAAAAEKMYTDESYDHELAYALNWLQEQP